MAKDILVDVWGVCISRDIFDIVPIKNIAVNVYYSVDPCCAMLEETKDKLHNYDFDYLGNWRCRNACHEYNHTVLNDYASSMSEWIVIDLRLMSYDGYGIYLGQNNINFCGGWLNSHLSSSEIEKYLRKNYDIEYRVVSVSGHEIHDEVLFDKWCSFIKKRYKKNIILIVPHNVDHGLFNEKIIFNSNYIARQQENEIINKYSLRFVNNVPCHVLIVPESTLSDYNHKWNYNPVHYITDVYCELSKCIHKIIIQGKDTSNEMILNIRRKNFSIVNNYYLSEKKSFDQIKADYDLLNNKADLYEFENKYCNINKKCFNQNYLSEYQYYLGMAYLHKNFIHDEKKASYWLLLSSRINIKAKLEMLNLSWKNNNYDLVKQLSIELIGLGNPIGMSFVGKLYHFGYTVEMDLNEAEWWMRQSINVGYNEIKNEYLDVLWDMRTSDSHEKMIPIATEMAAMGNNRAMEYLGRLYCSGKIGTDFSLSEYWFNEAIANGSESSKWRYCDLLWKINSVASLKKMIELLNKEYNSSNPEIIARLALAYKYGKGVTKDLKKSSELFSEILNTDHNWSKSMYFDVLWEMNDLESDKKMFIFALSESKKGNVEMIPRLIHAYTYGRGVDKNNVEAIKWIQTYYNRCGKKSTFIIDSHPLIMISTVMKQYKKYCVYYTSHYGSLLCMVLLALKNKGDIGVILIAPNIKDKIKIYDRLLKNGIVDIYIEPNSTFLKEKDEEVIVNGLNEYYSKIFDSIGVSLKDVTSHFINGDLSNDYGIYLGINQIPFSVVESSPGQFFIRNRSQYAEKMGYISRAYSNLQIKYDVLYGEIDKCSSLRIFYSRKHRDDCAIGSIEEIFLQLSTDEKKLLFDVFNVKYLKADSILIIQNSIGLLRDSSGMKEDQLPAIYQMFIDILFNEKKDIVIKPHPYTNADLYSEKYFGQIDIIDSNIPIELFDLSESFTAATIMSTGIDKLHNDKIKKLYTGIGFLHHFYDIPLYYVISKICEYCGCYSIELSNENNEISQIFSCINKKIVIVQNNIPSGIFIIKSNRVKIVISDTGDYKLKIIFNKVADSIIKLNNLTIGIESNDSNYINNFKLSKKLTLLGYEMISYIE